MLNAFRHHGNSHHRFHFVFRPPGFVLNAFRHHGNSHNHRASRQSRPVSVLNAFRHHGNSHNFSNLLNRFSMRCAQRLSASWEFSQKTPRSVWLSQLCSTPFGIMGILTNGDFRASSSQQRCSTPFGIMGILTESFRRPLPSSPRVLNAFRHHGNSHVRNREPARCPVHCAQRLSASWEFSRRSVLGAAFSRRSAQRLSASWEFSRDSLRDCIRYVQLCSTPFGIMGILTRQSEEGVYRPLKVLNAFRHHGNSHQTTKAPQVRVPDVLNAFRHHGNSHDLL